MSSEPSSDLAIRLLGGFEIHGPAGEVRLESAKTAAVLACLALTSGPVARARLQGLLWPDLPEARAAANLRRAIWDLRRRLNRSGRPEVIEAGHDDLRLAPAGRAAADVHRLAAALACRPPDLAAAAELYRGELLEGFEIGDAPGFEEWLALERERWHAGFAAGLEQGIESARAAGQMRPALAWARRLAALDPFRESAHRQVMELLLLLCDPAAALAQFEICRRLLAEELQTEPSAATRELATRIRAGETASNPERSRGLPPAHNLPAQATAFVGRRAELDRLAVLLDDPECTLLTLLGPGGIGKTRLAAQAAWRAVDPAEGGDRRFPDGIWFVPPLVARGPEALANALAEAVGLAPDPASERPLARRLAEFLRDRRLLLIVDGAEHVLDEARALAGLLAAAPELVLLSTSRERLGVEREWVFELGGLDLPAASRGAPAESGAVQLLLQSARRARVGFEPDAADLEAGAEICRRLEGSPLGIELAAGWIRVLDLPALARELADDLSLLRAPPGGVEAGLGPVFEASWSRLAESDRDALARLAVFRGGMTREDAQEVGGAGLAALAALVDRSLLRREPSGRYGLHEVLQSCALEKLAARPGELAATRARHARAIGRRACRLGAELGTARRTQALLELDAEQDNLRAAWGWAVESGDGAALGDCLDALVELAARRGKPAEVEPLISTALARRRSPDSLARRLHQARARLLNRLGRYAEAAAEAELALAPGGTEPSAALAAAARFELADADYLRGSYREAAPRFDQVLETAEKSGGALAAAAWARKGRIGVEMGNLDAAEHAFERSLLLARGQEDPLAGAQALAELGHVAYFRGELDRAERHFADAVEQARSAGDRSTAVQALHGLAFVAEERVRFDCSERYLAESLELARDTGDRRAVIYTLMLIGDDARLQGDLETARRRSEEALALARESGGGFLIGLLAGNLAYTASAGGDLAAARRWIAETLDAYRDSGSYTILLPALISLAEVRHGEGRNGEALELLGAVAGHPANRRDHQVEIDRVVDRIASSLPREAIASGLARGRGRPLDPLADAARAELTRCGERPPPVAG